MSPHPKPFFMKNGLGEVVREKSATRPTPTTILKAEGALQPRLGCWLVPVKSARQQELDENETV